ncbi:unnamed protein product [Effrenium voratum]|uniref:Uncharacterized protein n=1 Tax=Effrenium voratum TaxID=2562239 RepID=A0AA36MYJ6_9DINO|nr:unnamed protein product [Effrenium voratum]
MLARRQCRLLVTKASGFWPLAQGLRQLKFCSVELRPPGGYASDEKAHSFRMYIHRTVEKDQRVRMSPWGDAAIRNSLQALATAPKAVSFEVERIKSSEEEVHLVFESAGSSPWQEYLENRIMNTKRLAVTADTQAVKLARDLVSMLQAAAKDEQAVQAFAFWDDDAALVALAKGVAAVSSLYPFKRLTCVANVVNPMDDPRGRLFVYATFGEPVEPLPKSGQVFHAYPPGSKADPAVLKRFYASVEDRLHQGSHVHMLCLGTDAIMHSIRALCLVKGFTADLVVQWAPGIKGEGAGSASQSKASQVPRAVRLKATRGQTWEEFNATDFSKTSLRKVKSTTEVGKLAYAAVAEVRQHEAVAIHCFSDDKAAVTVAMKALAAVPTVTGGKKLVCVPSFGRAGPDQRPVLRLYAKRYRGQQPEQANPASG